MHAHAPSIETENRNKTKTAFLAAVLAVLIACFAALAAPPEDALARPASWGTQAIDNSGNSYKFGLDNIRITSQTNSEATVSVDVWVATAYNFNHRVHGWAYIDGFDKGSQGRFTASNSGGWSPTKETTWSFTVQKYDSPRYLKIEGAFQLDDESGAPWLYKAYSSEIMIPGKIDLSTGSLSMSPMNPQVGDTITASYYKSGVNTSDLKVSWWRGDTWNSAQLAQGAMSYSSGRTYKVQPSDVGTKLWCWVQGRNENDFGYDGIWKGTNEVGKKTLGTASLSLSPMSPSIGNPVTATFSMSGVSTSDLEVSWWKGDTWNQAVQVQGWTPYSSGRTYTPKSSDYGTKLWCWVHGSNQNIYDYDGLWKSTYAVTSVEPNTPASGASFYYTANSRLEFKSGSGMKVLEGGASSPSAPLVDSRKFCTVELAGASSSGTFVITNVSTSKRPTPYNTYDIAVTVGGLGWQGNSSTTAGGDAPVYFGFSNPYTYPSGNNFENPNQAGDKVSMWMKSWYWRADVSVKICRQGTTSAIGGFDLASRVSDIDISPGYTSYDDIGMWPPVEFTGPGALYNGFEFVRALSGTNISVPGNSYLQQDYRNKTVYSPKMSTPDINTNDDRYAAKLEGTGETGTVNLKYGGSDCGICFTFETMPAASIPLASPSPWVAKSADVSSVYEGELVKFTINAKNNKGNLTSAENFTIEDTLPSGLTYVDAVASIVPYGSSRDPETLGSPRVSVSGKTIAVKQTQLGGKDQIRLVVTARADGSKLGSVRNNVSAWCDSGSTDRHYADVTILERPRASLSVTKTAEPSVVEPGGEFAWKITVENTSGIAANNVTVTDTLPQGFEYASTDKGTVSGGKLTYNHGSLASGASFTVTVKGKAAASTAGTTLRNTAYASCSNGSGDNGSATLSVKKNPALSVEKASDALSYTVGDTVKWTVSVKNTVANTTARDVVVTDEVPAGVEVKNAKASCDDPQANVSASNNGNSVRATCDALPYGKTLVLEIEGVATAAGTLTNATDAESSNGGTAQGESTVTIEKPRAALTVAKTAVGGPWAVGDIVSYDVVVTNASAVDAEDVVVSDALPAGLEPVWCILGSFKGNVWTYEAGLLPAGKTISARIQAKALAAGEVVNTAKAESSNANPSEDKETVTVAPAPEYMLSKTAAKDAYKPGETIEWTVTLTRAQDQSARASARAAGLLPASDAGFVTPSAALMLECGVFGNAKAKAPGTGTAFAVYSEDDHSLNFYKRADVPQAGTQFEGKTATEVYTGFETEEYAPFNPAPWEAVSSEIVRSQVVDVVKPVSTAHWFGGFTSLTTLDVSYLDTSSVMNMASMFRGCSSLTALDLSGWDTSSVENMNSMFGKCSSLTALDVSGWDTSAVTSMANMFRVCSSLTALDVSGWDTSSVENMNRMFDGCSKLTQVSFGKDFAWKGLAAYPPAPDAGRIPGADGKWYAASDGVGYSPADIPSNKADTYYASKDLLPQAFAVYSADDRSLSFYKRDIVPKAGEQFEGKTATEVYTGIETAEYTLPPEVPWYEKAPSIEKIQFVDVVKPVSTSHWFFICSKLTTLDVSNLDTSSVTNMSHMFDGCFKLATLDTSSWNTSSVTNMDYMFSNCNSLTTLDVSNLDTSSVTNMSQMFWECYSIMALDLSSWDTSSVTKMSYMFDNCTSIEQITLGEKFAFVGTDVFLFSNGPDGLWYAASDGVGYAPDQIPSNKADTYYASKDLLPAPAVSVKDALQAAGVLNPSNSANAEFKPSADVLEALLGEAELKPGESMSWKVTAEVAPDAPDTIANAAVATLPDGSEKRAESVVAVIRPAQLAIAKTSDGETFAVGDVVAWNVELSNVGASPAFGWKISDTLPAGMEFSSATLSVDGVLKATFDAPQEAYSVHDAMTQAGALAPGSKAVLHIEAKATAAGEAVNRATGSAEDTAPVEAEDPVTIERPNVEIAKTADAQSYSVGDEVTYAIEVSNTSAHTARGVVVTDALPASLEFVSATAGEFKDGTLTWNVGELAAGATASIEVKAKAIAAGTVANKAVVSVDGCDPNESEEIVEVLEPVLAVAKTASAETAMPGDALSWTIEAKNTVPGSVARNVVVTDELPAGFVAESCDPGKLEGSKFSWAVGDLPYGQTVKATISGHIDPAFEGALENTAIAKADNSKPAEGTDSVASAKAKLAVSKTALGGPWAVGDVVSYDVVVTNVSTADAENVVATDTLPAELEPVWCSLGSFKGNVWSYSAGTLPAGKSFSVRIQAKALSAGDVTNTASADADNSDPAEDKETVTVAPAPEYMLSKTADKDVYAPGETIKWTVTLSRAQDQVTLSRAQDQAAHVAAKKAGLLPAADAGFVTPSAALMLEQGVVGVAENVPAKDAEETASGEAAPGNGAAATLAALAKGDAGVLAAPEKNPVEAFAVYSADDQSLNFYKRGSVPSKGSMFEGKTATYVWTGIEDEPISTYVPPSSVSPFSDAAPTCESVAVIDAGIAPKSTAYWFDNFHFLAKADIAKLDMSRNTDMTDMFFHCSSLKSLDISGWDTSAVKNMDNMFYGCGGLEKVVLGPKFAWVGNYGYLPANGPDRLWYAASDSKGYVPADVPSNKADTYYASKDLLPRPFAVFSADDGSLAFYNREGMPKAGEQFEGKTATEVYSGFENSDAGAAFGPWYGHRTEIKTVVAVDEGITPSNTAKWFYGLANCTSMDLAKLDMSKATSAAAMFENCYKLASADLSGWNAPALENASRMFYGCKALASADLSGWTAGKLADVHGMFNGCRALATLDLSGWHGTAPIRDANNAFLYCESLKALDLSGFDTSHASSADNMFKGCTALENAVLGDKFAWVGTSGYLPANGPDGKWYAASNGRGYAPADIPSNKADTYFTDKSLVVSKASVTDVLQSAGVLNPSNSAGTAFSPAGDVLEALLGEQELKPGESVSWTVTATVADDAPDTITNAAVATMPDGSEKRAESTVAVARPAQLEMTKTSEDEVYAVGETVHWNVELSNVGGTPAYDWAIADALPANVEFAFATLSVDGVLKASFDAEQESYSVHDASTQAGALAPGSKAVLHVAAKAAAEGEALNAATGSADSTPPVEAKDPVTIEKPTVDVAKTADATTYNVGDVVTYTIAIENSSPHPAYGVVVTDTLPAELEFVSATAGEFKDGTLTWNVGAMPPGAKDSVQIKAKAKAAGAVANKAVVSVEGCDPNESETIVDVLEPVLSVVKTASAESAEPGDALSWTIEVRNATEGSTAYNVVVTDVLPAGFVAESCDKGRFEGGKFVWEVGDLAFGEPAKATISGRIDPNYEGTLVNTAVATSDNSKPAEGSDTVSANGEVTVTFITDVSEMLPQGEKVFEQTVKKGEDFTPGPEADAAGHRDGCTRFDGWFLDPECTKPYTGGPIGDNLTLYGKNYAKIDYAWSALSKFPGETEPQYKAPAATAENLIWIGYELPLYDADGRPTSDGTGAPSVEVAYGERYELPAIADPVRYTWGGMAWIEYQAQFWHAREDLSDAALTPAGEKPFATGDATWWCKVAKGRYDGVIG